MARTPTGTITSVATAFSAAKTVSGISNAAEVSTLLRQGIDVVVTDHHEPGPGLPEGIPVADPKLAPYGAAAVEVMTQLGVLNTLRPKFVQGENIAQTHQFVATQNAPLGFVALSQAIGAGKGQWWVVPQADYAPIDQSAILLKPGENKAVAKAYLDFLRGPEARTVIEKYGYTIPR